MWSIILSGIKLLGGASALASKGMDIWAQKNNIDLAKFTSLTDAKKTVVVQAIQSDEKRIEWQGRVTMQAMNHPVWWFAWCLFVLPVGVYHAVIFAVSTLGIDPSVYAVLKVPPDQGETAKTIVLWIFGLQAGSGVAAGVLSTLSEIFGKARG